MANGFALEDRLKSARQAPSLPPPTTGESIKAFLGGFGGLTASQNPVLARRDAELEEKTGEKEHLAKTAKAQAGLQIQAVKDLAANAAQSGRFKSAEEFRTFFLNDIDPDKPGTGFGGQEFIEDLAFNLGVSRPELSAEQARVMAKQMIEPALQAFVSPTEAGTAAGQQKVAEAGVQADAVGGPPAQRQANFAKLIGVGPEKQGEFLTLLDTLKDTPEGSQERQFILGRVNRLSQAESGTSITVDKDGNVRVQMGGGAGGADIPTVTGSRLDELRAQSSATDTGLAITENLLQQVTENPGLFGVTGTARSFKETVEGVASDAASSTFSVLGVDAKGAADRLNQIIETETASDDVKSVLKPSSVGEMAVFEGILRYSIARTLQPEGRLLKDTVEQAGSMARLTGLTSSRQVRERLTTIQRLLQNRQSTLQQRMQQGVQGTTDVPVTPPTEGPAPGGGVVDFNSLPE